MINKKEFEYYAEEVQCCQNCIHKQERENLHELACGCEKYYAAKWRYDYCSKWSAANQSDNSKLKPPYNYKVFER